MASMFARQPDLWALQKVGLVTLSVLRSHNIAHVSDYREEHFRPLEPIRDFLLLEIYSAVSFRPGQDVRARYPARPSQESHKEFLERRFVEIYDLFHMSRAKHVAFMAVWVYAVEVMLYTTELQLGVQYIRITTLYLARFLSSQEFKNSCSFEQLIAYARLNVQCESRTGIWAQVRLYLRSRYLLYRWSVLDPLLQCSEAGFIDFVSYGYRRLHRRFSFAESYTD